MPKSKFASTVNPWGCGQFPKLVSPQFLLSEIEAAAECGADYYQIDDAWQQGEGLPEIHNNRNIDINYWNISQNRMAGTLTPHVELAKKLGIKLALWLAPTHNIEFEDHERFAQMLLDFYNKYGFDLMKIDGVFMRTYQAERNLEQILRQVREKSDGQVYFNLDTTNGQRAGFFMFLEYGNIFLENRYVCHTWGCGYHPEKTLKTLWKLVKYIRPETLQIEIPSPEQINYEFYKNKGCTAPDTYSFEYWMAITLFTNPLIWLAPSMQSAETRASLKKMMTLQKSLRDEILSGNVYPIGAEPGSGHLSGFYSDAGYLIVYRDNLCQISSEKLLAKVPKFNDGIGKLIAGNGELTIENGEFFATLPEKGSYALFRL